MADTQERWYWDRRTRKALYPTEVDEDENTVEFITVWHCEEVEDAIEGEALVPVEEVSSEIVDTTFDLLDSFRFPDIETDDE